MLPHSRPMVEKHANEKTAHLQEHNTSHLLSTQFLFSIKVRLQAEIGGKPPAEKAPHRVKQILKNEMKTMRLSCKLTKCEKIKNKTKNTCLIKTLSSDTKFRMLDPVPGTGFSSPCHLSALANSGHINSSMMCFLDQLFSVHKLLCYFNLNPECPQGAVRLQVSFRLASNFK